VDYPFVQSLMAYLSSVSLKFSLDSRDVSYRVRFAFNMPAVFDFLNGVSLRHEIEVSCVHALLPLENSLISHSSNYHSYS